MLQTELLHVTLVQEQCHGVFFSRDGGRVIAIIKDRDLGHSRTGAFDVNDLFPAVGAFAEGAHRSLDYDIKAARFLAGHKDHLIFGKTARHSPLGHQLQSLIVQFVEQTGSLQGRNLIEGTFGEYDCADTSVIQGRSGRVRTACGSERACCCSSGLVTNQVGPPATAGGSDMAYSAATHL